MKVKSALKKSILAVKAGCYLILISLIILIITMFLVNDSMRRLSWLLFWVLIDSLIIVPTVMDYKNIKILKNILKNSNDSNPDVPGT